MFYICNNRSSFEIIEARYSFFHGQKYGLVSCFSSSNDVLRVFQPFVKKADELPFGVSQLQGVR